MSETTDGAIIAGAIMAGPQAEGEDREAWEARVAEQAFEVHNLLGERSKVRQAMDRVANARSFTADITEVQKEKSTTRALVTLQSKPAQWRPDGVEQVRSERTDRPDGLLMAKRLVGLKGRKVRLWVEVEEFDGGKVRVIRHVQDLGEAGGGELAQPHR